MGITLLGFHSDYDRKVDDGGNKVQLLPQLQ